jgi:FAD/FMN-containing dehydrogenase
MMRHDRYRHVEMELFVPAPCLAEAATFLKLVLRTCSGDSLDEREVARSVPPNLMNDLEALKGRYVHHHVITVRKVLRDEALISMSSDIEAWYAISLITYRRDISSFLLMARFVARAMAAVFEARPHWGKTCPLDARDIAGLYPELRRFQACRAKVDPKRIFVNDFAWRHLGL